MGDKCVRIYGPLSTPMAMSHSPMATTIWCRRNGACAIRLRALAVVSFRWRVTHAALPVIH